MCLLEREKKLFLITSQKISKLYLHILPDTSNNFLLFDDEEH